ncbi:MAG: hypothetical protein AAFX04_03605 [Pseudomonadota bacterium]
MAQTSDSAETAVSAASEEEDRVAKARAMVKQAGLFNESRTLARWTTPICPKAYGFTDEQANQVEARVREVAQAVGAPVASGKCRANYNVYLTSEFARTLSGLRATKKRLFDNMPINRLEQIANSGASVFWLYDIKGEDRRDITYASVVIDRTTLAGKSIGTMSDFAAYVGMAEFAWPSGISPESILQAFSYEQATNQITEWDAKLLIGIYRQNLALDARAQRENLISAIAR